MSVPWLLPGEPLRFSNRTLVVFKRGWRRARARAAAKRQPPPDPAAWLATHEPTRCADGYAWGDTIADEDTDDAAEIARRHNLP